MIYDLRFTNKYKLVFFVFMLVVFMLSVNSALAHENGGLWTPGDPIVPCGITNFGTNYPPSPTYGIPCDQCQLLHLVKHLIDFVMVAAAPIIATLFIIIAGVHIMLGGANPAMLATGKRMFKDTMIGILIVMLAWLITNTLIKSLADPSKVGQGGNWYEFTCKP